MLVSVLFAVPVGFESNSWKVSWMGTLNGRTNRLFSDRYGDEKSDRVPFYFFYFDTAQWREGLSRCGSSVPFARADDDWACTCGRKEAILSCKKKAKRAGTNKHWRSCALSKKAKCGQELASPHPYSSDRHKHMPMIEKNKKIVLILLGL